MDENAMNRLLNLISNEKKRPSAQFFTKVLTDAAILLEKQPNINEINLEDTNCAIICGDIHGNLQAILQILKQNGMPSRKKIFIFNGDFVDRGYKSVEVLIIILALLLTYPNEVYLNRGNHEDIAVNEHYGFKKELKQKYSTEGDQLLGLCAELFRRIPVACIINEAILVCHGGIASCTDLEILRKLDRIKFKSILSPAFDGEDAVPIKDWEQLLNLLWSDPQQANGCKPNNFRGGGCYFGPDVTDAFRDRTGIQLIVRSHQCFPQGWQLTHSGHVITIFSSMDYYGAQTNNGAYLLLSMMEQLKDHQIDHDFDDDGTFLQPVVLPDVTQHTESVRKGSDCTHFPKKFRIITLQIGIIMRKQTEKTPVADSDTPQTKAEALNAALVRLWQQLLVSREEIITACEALDKLKTGNLAIREWCHVMTKSTKLQLPWRCIRTFLVHASSNQSMVKYNSMFDGVCIRHPMLENQHELVNELFSCQNELKSLVQLVDEEDTGIVNLIKLEQMLDATQANVRTAQLRYLVSCLIEKLSPSQITNFDFTNFLTLFRFVDIDKRNYRQP